MVFRNVAAYYERYLTVNVAMMAVPPMDAHGYFNFSVNNATARATLDKADVVILEINENLQEYSVLRRKLHISEVDMIVEGPHGPLKELPTPAATEIDETIAKMVVENMRDVQLLRWYRRYA